MCGIFGVLGDKKINNSKFISVSKILLHRGPDDEGFFLFNSDSHKSFKGSDSPTDLALPVLDDEDHIYTNALLHRRLSIIDLSNKGHQPMSYANETYWIILNGEIYNYLEIKKVLIKQGYTFHTDSDTEVVLAAYMEWGEESVKRFNGMWAFAIYDTQKQLLFCSRDRLGVKPFYYTINKGQFVFCSELKGIRIWLDNQTTLNENKIREYLIKGQVMVGVSEDTVFNDIFQLLPGHSLLFSLQNKKIKIKNYWKLTINITSARNNSQFYVNNFKQLFRDSIELRLRSDVEVGSCLSGGLDSSSIVCFGSTEFNKQFHTFSAIWPGTKHDESLYISLANNKAKSIEHLITYKTGDFIALHDKVIFHQELPLGGSSILAQWLVMELAKQNNIPVLLDGQGADEILSGYPMYLYTYINELFYNLRWREFFKNRKEWNCYDYSYYKIIKTLVNNKRKLITPLLPITNQQQELYQTPYNYLSPSSCNFLPFFIKEHIEKTNLPALLHYEDRNSMAHSIEARVPFLDYRLVEFTTNIPSHKKFKGALQKVILREAMKEYLPTPIYERTDKIGFSTPIEQNIISQNQEISQFMFSYLVNSVIWKSGWININNYNSTHLFALYSLARFIEIFS